MTTYVQIGVLAQALTDLLPNQVEKIHLILPYVNLRPKQGSNNVWGRSTQVQPVPKPLSATCAATVIAFSLVLEKAGLHLSDKVTIDDFGMVDGRLVLNNLDMIQAAKVTLVTQVNVYRNFAERPITIKDTDYFQLINSILAIRYPRSAVLTPSNDALKNRTGKLFQVVPETAQLFVAEDLHEPFQWEVEVGPMPNKSTGGEVEVIPNIEVVTAPIQIVIEKKLQPTDLTELKAKVSQLLLNLELSTMNRYLTLLTARKAELDLKNTLTGDQVHCLVPAEFGDVRKAESSIAKINILRSQKLDKSKDAIDHNQKCVKQLEEQRINLVEIVRQLGVLTEIRKHVKRPPMNGIVVDEPFQAVTEFVVNTILLDKPMTQEVKFDIPGDGPDRMQTIVFQPNCNPLTVLSKAAAEFLPKIRTNQTGQCWDVEQLISQPLEGLLQYKVSLHELLYIVARKLGVPEAILLDQFLGAKLFFKRPNKLGTCLPVKRISLPQPNIEPIVIPEPIPHPIPDVPIPDLKLDKSIIQPTPDPKQIIQLKQDIPEPVPNISIVKPVPTPVTETILKIALSAFIILLVAMFVVMIRGKKDPKPDE